MIRKTELEHSLETTADWIINCSIKSMTPRHGFNRCKDAQESHPQPKNSSLKLVGIPLPAHAHDNGTQYLTLHHRVSGRVATDIVFSNALLVVALWTTREWLLSQNVGAFWVLMRILACGALGLGLREVASGDAPKALEAASSAKVRTHALLFFLFFSAVGFCCTEWWAKSGPCWLWAP
jgi:hypothetical protein